MTWYEEKMHLKRAWHFLCTNKKFPQKAVVWG